MQFQSLAGQNFRNLKPFKLEFSPGLNLILGQNASGKTNLLEALGVLVRGRSPRLKNATSLIQHGMNFTHLEGRVEEGDEVDSIHFGLDEAGKRRLKLNQKPTRKLSELVYRYPIVTLFPEDLEVPKGSPSLRRAFLDRLASQVISGYLPLRSRFEKILKQRNAALRTGRPQREVMAHNPGFLREAVEIFQIRSQVLENIKLELKELPEAKESETIEIEYWAFGKNAETIHQILESRLVSRT